MRKSPSSGRALERVRRRAKVCRNCDLWRRATHTVFGAGPAPAELMLVGEQPGDQEDLAGEPFVGAAGRVLDEALTRAGIDRAKTYVTNAVKHFKWEPRGKRRIHKKPNQGEIRACHLWLDEELAHVKPKVLVALGATAAGVVAGPSVRVTRDRGKPIDSPLAPKVFVTVHPSSILRATSSDDRREAMEQFVKDLKKVARALGQRAGARASS
jgi:uracil-DNA glycosylase family protein